MRIVNKLLINNPSYDRRPISKLPITNYVVFLLERFASLKNTDTQSWKGVRKIQAMVAFKILFR